MRKAKAKLVLNLARGAKNNRKGFYRYVNQEMKVKECVPHLINSAENLIAVGEEKAEVLNTFFLSLHWQPLFPQLSSAGTERWGLEEQSPSHSK